VEEDGALTMPDVINRLGDMPDAAARLQQWGWRAGSYRIFGCVGPPPGEAGWIEMNVHLFADPASAQEAVGYFATARSVGTMLTRGDPPPIGDVAVSLSGPAFNGKEFTIYASSGPRLIRVTGISPSGIPFSNVLATVQAIIDMPLPDGTTSPPPPELDTSRSAEDYLPHHFPVAYATCFRLLERGTYPQDEVASWFVQAGATPSQFDVWGWQDGAYLVMRCDEPPPGVASQFDVVVHVFRDEPSAQATVPYAYAGYVPGADEARLCDSARFVLTCVTGRSPSGPPVSDVRSLLQVVLDAAA
jgi:hypothetical protein